MIATTNLSWLDLGVIIGYVLMIVSVGCGATWFHKRKAHKNLDEEEGGYFLAGGALAWPIIGLSLFSTNISTVHIVGLAEGGFKHGMALANFELAAVFTLVILAVFFVPFYLRARVTTLPDFLEKRFGRSSRDFLAVVSILSAIFIHIGVSLYAGAKVINYMLGWESGSTAALMPTMVMIAVATGIYVVVGGLLAVTLTDSIQTTTLLIGSGIVTYFSFTALDGAGIMEKWQTLQTTVGPEMTSVLRSSGEPSGYPWHAVLFGYPVIGIWYWCTDQTIVQRVLGAKNEHHGKAGALFAAFLKLLPMFIFVLPGLLCLALITTNKLPMLNDSANCFAHMVLTMLPNGLKGLIVAALLAALMGTIAGALNSIATLFAYDLYKRVKPETTEKKLVFLGRITTVVSVVLAIAWSPVIASYGSIYGAIVSLICYVAPPITATFMVGIFWKRATAKAATITLWSGFSMGVVILLLDLNKAYTGWSIASMHATAGLCLICTAILIIASLITENTNTEENLKLVWDSPLTPLRISGSRGLMNYKFLSAVVLIAACGLYYMFRIPSDDKMNAWAKANPKQAETLLIHNNSAKNLIYSLITASTAEGQVDFTAKAAAIENNTIDPKSRDPKGIQTALNTLVSQWLDINRESVVGVRASKLDKPAWGEYTRKPGIMYAHVYDWPKAEKAETEPSARLEIAATDLQITKVYLLADNEKTALKTQKNKNGVLILLPENAPDRIDSVVVIEHKSTKVADVKAENDPVAPITEN